MRYKLNELRLVPQFLPTLPFPAHISNAIRLDTLVIIRIGTCTVWNPYTHVVNKAKWNILELPAAFLRLSVAGIIRDLKTEAYFTGRLNISFLYPSSAESHRNSFFCKALDEFFDKKIQSKALCPCTAAFIEKRHFHRRPFQWMLCRDQ